MSTEPEKTPQTSRPARRRLPAKPIHDGFVVFEVDGFAQLTPEQRDWPVVTPEQMTGRNSPPATPDEQAPPA